MSLAAYAASDNSSRGRKHPEEPPAYRSEYQRDRDRIVHCAAFRRLEYKTQVFVNHEGDLFRTRLTHSIEVAQIGRSIARSLGLNEDLTEAIALAHDLGHTPFGHTGQDALNECMKNYGGFEHNLQSLRVVDWLEERYAEFPGLNLTFETREGILKHCPVAKARELGDVGERFITKQQAGAEAQLVNLADEIAYSNHDVDDGLRYGLIGLDALQDIQIFADYYNEVRKRYPDLTERRQIYETIRRMINHMVIDLVENSGRLLAASAAASPADIRTAPFPLIAYSEKAREQILALKRFLRGSLYSHVRVERMSQKSADIIRALFGHFLDDPLQLPRQYQEKLNHTGGKAQSQDSVARIIADYIAGMTDRYAIAEYQRIFELSPPA